jgi:molybdopterin adenylyltransferase
MKILVLTLSDRAFEGVYEDLSGPAVEKVLRKGIPGAEVERLVVSDDEDGIEKALAGNLDKDVIITTGGSGIGPRDHAPDVTARFCDALIPGIAEYLRRESFEQTSSAVLSRGVAGYKGTTIVVNVPGSVKGAVFCAGMLAPILPHACDMIRGRGHGPQ